MHLVSDDENVSYGCIFCKTGYEISLATELSANTLNAQFIVAQKKFRRRIHGKMQEETTVMFPGYVFFKADRMYDPEQLNKNSSVLKLLKNGDCDGWQLLGDDRAFVAWLFSLDGIIGFSKALVEGDRLRIVRGPLMGHEGKILKVNRRFQNCLVALRFEDKEFKVWLGYELNYEII